MKLKIDLQGQKFGRWEVVSFSHFAPNRKGAVWNCVCECGSEKKVNASRLRCGDSRSCGCLHRDISRSQTPDNFKDITGQVFGRLTVLHRGDKTKNQTAWVCLCSCGNKVTVLRGNLINGRQLSCGCYMIETRKTMNKTHGFSQTRLYKVWVCMLTRCYNPKCSHYDCYGGRGIGVSNEWRNDYVNFHNDMASGYQKGLQLDRIDVNGDYCKSNCRWVTAKQNARNKRNTIYITYDGVQKPLTQLAEDLGVKNFAPWYDRVRKNWKTSYIINGKPVFDSKKMIIKK